MEDDLVYDEFASDSVAGIIIMCLAVFPFLFGVVGWMTMRSEISVRQEHGFAYDVLPYIYSAVMLIAALGLGLSGYWVKEGERRGFLLILPLSIPLIFGGWSNVIVAAILAGYAGLRLWGRLGPEPSR